MCVNLCKIPITEGLKKKKKKEEEAKGEKKKNK